MEHYMKYINVAINLPVKKLVQTIYLCRTAAAGPR